LRFHLIRAQKFPENGQIQRMYQPSTWACGVHDSYTQKGRQVSAEVLTVHSVPAHCTVSVPISHLVPAQSGVNLRGKEDSCNTGICKDQTFVSVVGGVFLD
jgi:hypothetical protein